MSTSDIEFTLRCSNLLTSLRVSHPLAHSTARQLLDAYTESTRFYHTLDHTRHLLSGYDTTSELIQNKDAVQLAIWFHDCVYDPIRGAPYNELESIKVWEALVDQAPSLEPYRQSVTLLINCTIHHRLPSPSSLPPGLPESDIAHFLDLDVAVLASPRDVYETYAQQIRREYAHVSTEDYKDGRGKVLHSFLERDKIFVGDEVGKTGWEKKARENLKWEIEELQNDRIK